MPRITLRQLLDHAAERGYAVPAFNINNMEQGLAIVEAAAATQGVALRNREVTVAQEQREITERLVTRSRASDLIDDRSAEALERETAANINEHTAVVMEMSGFLRTGQMLGRELALIERRAQAAAVWTASAS